MFEEAPILKEIRQGFRLRPTKTIDRSAPVIVADGERLGKIIVELPQPPPQMPPVMAQAMPPAPPPLQKVNGPSSGFPGPPGPPPPPQQSAPKRAARPAPVLMKLGGNGGSRDELLAAIRGGVRLKKAVVHDKSAPIIAAEYEEGGGGRQMVSNGQTPAANGPASSGLMSELQNSVQFSRFQEAADTNVPTFMTQKRDEWVPPPPPPPPPNEIRREPMATVNTVEERKPNSVPIQQNSFVAESPQEKTKPAFTRQPSAELVRKVAAAQHQGQSTSSQPLKQNAANSASAVASANILRAIEERRRDEPTPAPPPPPPPPPSFNPYRIEPFQPPLEAPRTERIIETKFIPKPKQERIIETKVIPKPTTTTQPEINNSVHKQPSPPPAHVAPKKQQQQPASPPQAQSQFVPQKQSFVPQPQKQTSTPPPKQTSAPANQTSTPPPKQQNGTPFAKLQSAREAESTDASPVVLPSVNRLRQSFDKAVNQQPVIPKSVGLPPPKPLSTQSVFLRNSQLRASSPPKVAFASSNKATTPSSPAQKHELSVALEPDVRESRSFEAERVPVSVHRQKSVEFVRRAPPGKLRDAVDSPPSPSSVSNNNNNNNNAANTNSMATIQPNSAERQWKSVVANKVNGHSSEQQQQQPPTQQPQDKRHAVYNQSEGLLPQVNRLRSAFEANESDSDNSSEISEQRYGQTIVLPVSPRQNRTVPVKVLTTRTVKHVNGGGVPTSTPWVVTKDKVINNADKNHVSSQLQQQQERKLEQQQRKKGDGSADHFGPAAGRAHKVVIGSNAHNMVDSPFETMPVDYMHTNYKFTIDLSDNETPIQILQR
uniref:WH2 domain-containing protein n=1 Tax=Plectus sambesii TaxID=2011161 RepID=A0A914VA43_9BILA